MHSYFNTSRAYLPHNSSKIEGWRCRITTQLQTFSTQVTLSLSFSLSLSLLSDCFYLWHGALALILSTAQLAFFFFFLFLFYPLSLSLSCFLVWLLLSLAWRLSSHSLNSSTLPSSFSFFSCFTFLYVSSFTMWSVAKHLFYVNNE